MKTHRGAAKRFKLTASGKWKRAKAYRSHKLGKKSSKRRRRLRKMEVVSPSDQKRLEQLLP
jgi:large subunit ribosomal protein L35